MAGHSRPEGRRRFRSAYVPAIHVLAIGKKGVDARVKPGHDGVELQVFASAYSSYFIASAGSMNFFTTKLL
jgi:hypothetical protein